MGYRFHAVAADFVYMLRRVLADDRCFIYLPDDYDRLGKGNYWSFGEPWIAFKWDFENLVYFEASLLGNYNDRRYTLTIDAYREATPLFRKKYVVTESFLKDFNIYEELIEP